MSSTELFLIAMVLIFSVPYLIWRIFRTDHYAPLVAVQIGVGILLGPGILGALFPNYYTFVITPVSHSGAQRYRLVGGNDFRVYCRH